MVDPRRVVIAVALGLVMGLICYFAGNYVIAVPLTAVSFWIIILSRAMIGS